MSVKELQASIEEISADIDRQQEVLKNLEHSRSALQRQLNALCDPVAQLPLEISGEIFMQCVPIRPQLGAHHAPMVFLNICNAWTNIAISTPGLWTAIHIEFLNAEAFSELLEIWLIRARNHSLSISLRTTFYEDVATIVQQHTEQINSLGIYGDEPRYLDRPATMGSFPSLETLTIGSLGPLNASVLPRQGLAVLGLAPNLVACTLCNFFTQWSPADIITDTLVLPNLRYLKFGRDEARPNSRGSDESRDSDDDVLRYLSLPALETLYLPMTDLPLEDFASFLKRSSPPLQKLVVSGPHRTADLEYIPLDECLRLVPLLTHFELYSPDERFLGLDPFFAALAEAPSTFLPSLQIIKIHDHPWETSYELLVRALSVRRGQITQFELHLIPDATGQMIMPAAEIRVALQELVADGMDIHIGPK
ncbi:hypothetical protein B0H17DRAFT_1337557 [Mycena rosella]|uniref:F-box domain-containing protein n=1 Tax=Mycena rosella TaxID=1033263 RepID=A0AAD7CRE6_MYCRO|nr:hypothetical protein B0H17DRAFT_1337557 [Mycena rosella]